MNKLKAWLIRKLGGCVYLEQSQKIVFETLPCVTGRLDIELPQHYYVIAESEKCKIVDSIAAEKIGRFIVDNGLCEISRTNDTTFRCEKFQCTLRIVRPPDKPIINDDYNSTCCNEALKIYGQGGYRQ